MKTSLRKRASAPRGAMKPGFVLRLYVAGASPNSVAAIGNLKALQARLPLVPFELEIIDILLEPRRALSDAILVTPTLLKLEPAPSCRILGSLRDADLLLRSLGLAP